MIELLSGESISQDRIWVYPFKHFVVYEKQIKKFVELLNETDVDPSKAKDLVYTLARLTEDVVSRLGPMRSDDEYSIGNVTNILQTKGGGFVSHFAKAEQRLANDREETKSGKGKVEGSPIDHSTSSEFAKVKENCSQEESKDEVSSGAKESTPSGRNCTCLRDAKDHLKLLVNVLDEYLGDILMLRQAISDRLLKKIKFEHLWHLYQPGDLVISSKQPYQAYRVIHVSGGRPLMTTSPLVDREGDVADVEQDRHRKSKVSPFMIDCIRFDFDGYNFGPVQETVGILPYDEERKITALDLYPMSFAEDEAKLRDMLVKRGQWFAEYREFKHKRYVGLSLGDPQEEVREKNEPSKSRESTNTFLYLKD